MFPGSVSCMSVKEKPRYFKETDEGVKAMCKVMDEVRREAVWKKTVEIVKGMLELNLSHEQIAHAAKITVDQVREIAGEQSA